MGAACSREITSPPARSTHVQPAVAPAPQFGLFDPALVPGGHGNRNLFAFREKPVVVVPAKRQEPPPAAVVEGPRDGVAVVVRGPDKPVFPYRCIGRFGPKNAQLAAFVVDGEVKLARAGEVLADKYLVRGVGIESVEVALLSAPEVSWRLEFGK